MNYHPDDFLALAERVQEEGGAVLDEPCTGRAFRIKKPVNGKMQWRNARTTHCDLTARMAITYDPTQHVRIRDDDDVILAEHPGEAGRPEPLAIVCAVDDAMGLWPRYAGVVSSRSYEN